MSKTAAVRAGIAGVALASLMACAGLALAGEGAASSSAADAQPAVTITGDEVQEYCGMCHFATVENASIASFNSANVDRAMVESMVPQLDDDTIDALTAYFSQIEPPADDGAQQH